MRFENSVEEQGFGHLSGFLNQQEIDALRTVFDRHYSYNPDVGMWNSLYNIPADASAEVGTDILAVLHDKISALLGPYWMPSATFMTKNPNEHGVCELHRDFSVVDERTYEYRNVWIPLVDTTRRTGALYVLPCSHKVFDYPLPMFTKWPYEKMQEKLFEAIEVIEAKAGDLVVYSDRTLHGSFLHQGEGPRPVVHFGIFHPDCELMYYHLEEDGLVKVYPVPYAFYFENKFGNQDHRFPVRNKFQFDPPQIELGQVLQAASNSAMPR